MVKLLLRSVGQMDSWPLFKELLDRFTKHVEISGTKWTAQYMKEITLILLARVNRSEYVPAKGAPHVRRSSHTKIPSVIPVKLRFLINNEIRDNVERPVNLRILLTILAFARTLQVGCPIKLDTITDPHTGTMKTLPTLEMARVVNLLRPGVSARSSRLVWSGTSGPNGPNAMWFAPADALAYLFHLDQFRWLATYSVLSGQLWIPVWIVLFWIVAGPPTLLISFWYKFQYPDASAFQTFPKCIGRLSVLREGAGKNRVVAVCDWWTQCAFKGLHQSIFQNLRNISNDGTFDQWKPVEAHVLPKLGQSEVYSYDLSSATDRLPLQLQVDLLTMLVGHGLATAWSKLLLRG